jgi:hypothetical protein
MMKTEYNWVKSFGHVILSCFFFCAACSGVDEREQPAEEPTEALPKPKENKSELAAVDCDVPLDECGGACTNLQSDSDNCGACGNICPSSFECEQAVCVALDPCASGICECISPEVECGGRCTNLENDNVNCGACDNSCPSETTCKKGSCTCENPEEAICSETCVSLDDSPEHCGACDNSCVGEEQCLSGICACTDESLSCDGICVDSKTDPENCGSCGATCARHQECSDGTCLFDENPDNCQGAPLHLQLTRVSLYQGVEVDLFRDGMAVAQVDQAVDIIAQRRALVRLFTTADIDYESIQTFPGNYDQYMIASAEARLLTQKENAKKQTQITELKSFVSRFSANASKAKQASSDKNN